MKKKRGEGIVQISKLFSKYKNTLRAPQKTVINEFRGIVYEETGIEIGTHQCLYTPQNKMISLTTPGPIKTEILFKKKKILERLTQVLGEKSSPKNIL